MDRESTKRYTLLQALKLWNGSGDSNRFSVATSDEFRKLLTDCIDEAIMTRREQRKESSRRSVLKSLTERGLKSIDQLSGFDQNDLVGLIGEIVTSDFVVNLSMEPIFQKWRRSGSSKSPGIDLVAREREGETWKLVLYEVKHLHNEARNKETEVCWTIIRSKFKTGIDAFGYEQTSLNLTDVVMTLDANRRTCRAIGSDIGLASEYRDLIQNSLVGDSYRLNVVVLVDSRHCNNETLRHSASEIPAPVKQGENHSITLSLLEPMRLEELTDEMCNSYVGTI